MFSLVALGHDSKPLFHARLTRVHARAIRISTMCLSAAGADHHALRTGISDLKSEVLLSVATICDTHVPFSPLQQKALL